jgi:hypothetical protein
MKQSSILQVLLLLPLCFPVFLNAQVANANMNVAVHDGSGAVVPGAAVKVTNNQTGLIRSGVANERGELQVPFLPVGPYSVSAESAGRHSVQDRPAHLVDAIRRGFRHQCGIGVGAEALERSRNQRVHSAVSFRRTASIGGG